MKFIIFLFITVVLFSGCVQLRKDYPFDAEGRGVWMSPSPDTNWDSTMAVLSKSGFNMIFPYMCSSGMSYYPSEFLPMKGEEDQLKKCIEAAHRYGIEVHVWKMNWNLNGIPADSVAHYEKENRIQISYDHKRVPQVSRELGWNQKFDWLCPSHPDNRKLEKNIMFELVRKYDIDGIHFDYMRYPYEPFCYCQTCQERFGRETGLEIVKWPDDVWKGGKYRTIYLEWRKELITSSAEEIAKAIHDFDPYVCVSLAARPSLNTAYLHDGQIWWEWDDKSILDFVCPMNYSPDPEEYLSDIQQHLPFIAGNIPYYGGIGLFLNKKSDMLKESIRKGRRIGQDGFVVFSYGWGGLSVMLDTVARFLKLDNPVFLPHRAPRVSFKILESPETTETGLPGYRINTGITCEVVIPLKAKLREGIVRIQGELIVLETNQEFTQSIMPINIAEVERYDFILNLNDPGLYRIILTGEMELSNGEIKPFVSKSYPFILL